MSDSVETPAGPAPDPALVPDRVVRPVYWSVRRELWENRSVFIVPLIVAAVVLFGSLMGLTKAPAKVRALAEAGGAVQYAGAAMPIRMSPAPIMLVSFIVGVFYCLDALYGERRDRSILFWKSLPLSDRNVVLSKLLIPLAVLPAVAFVLSLVSQILLFLAGSAILLGSGLRAAPLWQAAGLIEGIPIMIYGLGVHALWFAPIYGWCLLISAWARRVPFLWAALPFLALLLLERLWFDTSVVRGIFKYRFAGAMREAFSNMRDGDVHGLSQLSPLRFLTSPGLWIGLLVAAACVAAAIRLRRHRDPAW